MHCSVVRMLFVRLPQHTAADAGVERATQMVSKLVLLMSASNCSCAPCYRHMLCAAKCVLHIASCHMKQCPA